MWLDCWTSITIQALILKEFFASSFTFSPPFSSIIALASSLIIYAQKHSHAMQTICNIIIFTLKDLHAHAHTRIQYIYTYNVKAQWQRPVVRVAYMRSLDSILRPEIYWTKITLASSSSRKQGWTLHYSCVKALSHF